ncbi:MAG: cupredoxin domain-containing protein [Nitrososphaerales archaeon]
MSSNSTGKSETLTVTVKTKWLWLVLGIVLALLAVAPVVYSALPSTAQGGSGGSGGGGSAPPSSGATPNCGNPCTIVIANSLFGTVQPIIVKTGTTVTWQNKDNTQHTTTSDSPGVWDSRILSPGQSFSVTFNSTGTYTYHCNILPMTGTIEVVT